MSKRPAGILVRPAAASDREFVLSLVPRFVEFGPPPWRDAVGVMDATLHSLEVALETENPDDLVLVAVNMAGARLGFIHLQIKNDYFSNQAQAYVADVAVSTGAEGRGVGRTLMETAEEWAHKRGCEAITLNVFSNNLSACAFYENLGYREETRFYVKILDPQDKGS